MLSSDVHGLYQRLIMSNPKQKEILILFLCLLIGFALRFYTFDQKSLWIDEIHTYNDSRDGLSGQIRFYKENPTYLHPPLFFVLTHLFYPFTKPERDLRIIPLIFGTLSIPMFYFLSRCFSPGIALPCTISLSFMAYHIYFSQDGRPYSLVLFLGMAGLYFFLKHLKTLKKKYLFFGAVFFAILFHVSYTSIVFIVLSQILWFYHTSEDSNRTRLRSFLIFNGTLFLLCTPWLFFLALNYNGQPVKDPFNFQDIGPLSSVIYGVLNDWVPHLPLTIASVLLLTLSPFLLKIKRNAFILLALSVLPVGGLYLCCLLLNITQFITSRYLVGFLPLFFITIYSSLNAIELRFERLRKFIHPSRLFLLLFIASNLITLPLYYRAEKQNFRGLVNYLNGQLRDGDKIFVRSDTYIPGMLHYFGVYPQGRHYTFPYYQKDPGKEFGLKISLISRDRHFTIYYSNTCCSQYVIDGSRLWIVVGKPNVKQLKESSPSVLKGVFDGSFSNFRRFPSDASMYLFLWDSSSPGEKGIDMPIE